MILVGDGHCQDEANNAACSYDGGDCCLPCMTTDSCTECLCHDGGVVESNMACKSK